MRTLMFRCGECARYTLAKECPECGSATASPLPPRYSPEDRYGKYRRMLAQK
ncbi:MAG: RNA-protein complex protein Nop10 [Candidatus Poseidoniia archaeon]|jgi:H/ACA ribonucleoprotein complex subunit 3|nr:RNA-protein complex protein Nop10 [Candidatus Poseidoniia archaeon]MDP7006693.1 RNA-protein complex protein Nop10 [Candidatus Poseidoniia archaeon]